MERGFLLRIDELLKVYKNEMNMQCSVQNVDPSVYRAYSTDP